MASPALVGNGHPLRALRAVISVSTLAALCLAAVALAAPPGGSAEYAVYVRVVGPDAAGDVVPIAGASVRAYPSVGTSGVTNANGEAVVPIAESVQGGDYVHVLASAAGYQTGEMRYLIDQQSAVRVVRNQANLLVKLVDYLRGHKESFTTLALERGEDAPTPNTDQEIQMTVEVKDAQLAPVSGAAVVFCCSTPGRFWDTAITGHDGKSSEVVPRQWIENGLQLQVTHDGLSRYSDVPLSILDEAGERLFLVTLPDKEPTHTWAGDWKDSFGGFGLRWLPWEQFVMLPEQAGHEQLWDKLKALCPLGAEYYEGGYYDPPTDAGKVVACAARGGKELVARYLSEYDGHGGFFKITMSSPTAWSGIYRDDGGEPAPWSGTFEKHFAGDGA